LKQAGKCTRFNQAVLPQQWYCQGAAAVAAPSPLYGQKQLQTAVGSGRQKQQQTQSGTIFAKIAVVMPQGCCFNPAQQMRADGPGAVEVADKIIHRYLQIKIKGR
jgi:hypothetical protein